ncbi:MAG TPA: DUF1800 domain-containing protein [Candidatus Kapabacteria bacterium]
MDRRKFLTGTGTGILAGIGLASVNPLKVLAESDRAIPGYGINQANAKPLPTLSNDLTPYTGPWNDVKLRHVLRRAMFGVPYSQFVTAKGLGSMNAVVAKLLEDKPMPTTPGPWLEKLNIVDRSITDPDKKQIDLQNKQRLSRFEFLTVQDWWFDRMLKEEMNIREKMTLMWSNHFVVGYDVIKQPTFMFIYNQMLRKNALGNLKTFAYEMSTDPAMLYYLNGNQNTYQIKNGKTLNNINENFARELMELFTLGIYDPKTGEKNYTEEDIQQAAKALTGWQPMQTAPFASQFVPTLHNNETKTFFGQTGNFGLQEIIDNIFAKNGGYNVAYFICEKIYINFVYWVPNPTVVGVMAEKLIASNWELKPVVVSLLESAHFYDENVIGAQLKSPFDLMGSLVREFGLVLPPVDATTGAIPAGVDSNTGYNKYNDPNPTHTYLAQAAGMILGQDLLNPPNVKGWAGGHAWVNTGTLPTRKSVAYAALLYPNYFNGNAPRSKGVKIIFDPMSWANSIPGAASMTSVDITNALSDQYLSFDLGSIESGVLESVVSLGLPKDDFYLENGRVAQFAQGIALLPEFQLM